MAVFIDYYRPQDTIVTLAVRENNGIFHAIQEYEIERTVAYLMGTENIVVYHKAKKPIMDALEGYEHYLEDQNINERWTDLYYIIKNASEEAVALSKVAKSTLGLGPQSNILRLKEEFSEQDKEDLEPKMEQRLSVLQQVYDYARMYGQVSFEKNEESIWVEVDIDESPK